MNYASRCGSDDGYHTARFMGRGPRTDMGRAHSAGVATSNPLISRNFSLRASIVRVWHAVVQDRDELGLFRQLNQLRVGRLRRQRNFQGLELFGVILPTRN